MTNKEVSQADCETILSTLTELSGDMTIIKEALLGKIESNGHPGILERVRKLEDWIKDRNVYEKIVIVAVLTNIVGLGFVIIKFILKI